MKPLQILSFLVFAGLLIFSFKLDANAQSIKIYVAANGNDSAPGTIDHPLKTINHAQQLARSDREQHPSVPINIFLRAGTYYPDNPLVFTPKDNPSGDAPIIFKTYHHEKVIISGGRRLYVKWSPWKNGIYKAKLHTALSFDQFFINGKKQVRARYPNYDSSVAIFNGASREALSTTRIKPWEHPAGGFIHALQKYHWGSLSYRITDKNKDGSLQVEGGYQMNRSHQIDSNAVFVENIFEELDTAHEWYYDSAASLLYYMPPKHLNLQKAEIEVSVLTELIIFNGDTLQPVSNIHFEGITFMHTKETFMLTREPLLRGDWNIFRGGAVLLSGAERCTFSNCNFESLGGNAIFFSNYNRYDTIEHCIINDAGANGICFVGSPLAVRSPSFNYGQYVPYDQLDKVPGPKNNNFPRDCDVYDNLIYNIGQIEKQTAGVELSMCMNISVINNTIYHVPRSGINVNDGCWGGDIIENNDVFETVLETGDNGAFNSWGRDRYWSPDRVYMDSLVAMHPELIKLDMIHTILIRHNRFRCDHGWDIDLDDGSSNYIIDSNLCLSGGIKNREGFYRIVKNNIMVDNTFHPHVWFKNSHDIFMHNIVMKPYAPIQIAYWGDTIDYNLFPDSMALLQAQANGTDMHSKVEFPSFYDPHKGDYRVKMDGIVQSIGFENFTMGSFGVMSPHLRAISKQPVFPVPVHIITTKKRSKLFEWEGATIKNVTGINEQSALGLAKAEGIYIVKISEDSPAYKIGFRKNDVILKVGDREICSVSELREAIKSYHSKSSIDITVFRNQQTQILVLNGHVF